MIEEKLNDNLNLIIEPTNKFKSISIRVNFAAALPQDYQAAVNLVSQRALMAAILEVSSKKYSNNQSLNNYFADHYGSDFNIELVKLGMTHQLQISYKFVADQYLDSQNQLSDAIEFLEQQILAPAFNNQALFETEKNNLINLLKNQDENLNFYANKRLAKDFYDDQRLTIDANGDLNQLTKINLQDLSQTHQMMIENDQITIVVVGDVDSKQVVDLFKKSDLNLNSQNPNLEYFYQQANHRLSYHHEVKNINQSKLLIAYNLTSVNQNDDQRFAAYLFNALLGGTPQSKLFVNLREAESLAYSINSFYNRFTNSLVIQAGIDGQNFKKTDSLIDEQIEQIRRGDFAEELIEDIKLGLINDNLSLSDSLSSFSYQILMQSLLNNNLSNQMYAEKISQVTSEQIIELSNKLEKQDQFLLTNDK